jgi:aryl-alcohol dehydrogenase-like predicted oxidoreductase
LKYRSYGKTGVTVSEIGMGGHREGVDTRDGVARRARFFKSSQERAAIVGKALECGVTYFDTTYGVEIASLGESLRLLEAQRDTLFVSGMRVDFFSNLLSDELDVRAYTRREVEGRIKEFGFDHLDQFIMGAMEGGDPLSHPRSILEDVFDELYKLRDEGKLKHIGFSCHEPDYAARLLAAFPNFDAVMAPYSFMNREAQGDLTKVLEQTGAAFIGMKSLVWRVYGVAASAIKNLRPVPGVLEHDPDLPVAKLALQHILTNPMLSTCVPAANSIEMVIENCSASGCGPLTPAEEQAMQIYADGNAMEKSVILAIGGLFATNARALASAIGHLNWTMKLDLEPIDWESDDAENLARKTALELLNNFREDPKWASFIP